MFCHHTCVFIFHTCNTGVIYQDDFFEQDGRRRVQDTEDRPEEGGPSLIVEDNNNTGGRQRRTATKLPLHAPKRGEPRWERKKVCKSERGVWRNARPLSCRAIYTRLLFADIQGLNTDILYSPIVQTVIHTFFKKDTWKSVKQIVQGQSSLWNAQMPR